MPEATKVHPERFEPRSRKAWRRWLKNNGSSSPGLWLVISKKNSGRSGVSYEDAVEEALCFGWIDSKLHTLDENRFLQNFVPRKPGSDWSQRNKRRVKKLIAEGLMTGSGLKKIAAARIDGSWNRLDMIDQLKMPSDFRKALSARKKAAGNLERFSDSTKKMILYWIVSAKRPETRSARIEKTVSLAARNIRADLYRYLRLTNPSTRKKHSLTVH